MTELPTEKESAGCSLVTKAYVEDDDVWGLFETYVHVRGLGSCPCKSLMEVKKNGMPLRRQI
jgi:hypothetical protein